MDVAGWFGDDCGMLASDCGGSSGVHARLCSCLPNQIGLCAVCMELENRSTRMARAG